MKSLLSPLLSLNGGYVDTAGFLALSGLFTAHVTGNFVTLGATLAQGSSGTVSKLLVLPVFCIVIILARLAGDVLQRQGQPVMRIMLGVKFLLLAAAATIAILVDPFDNADAWAALATGMTLASAMAVQNAIHRGHMTNEPPTTLMTGTTTQIMMDIADLITGIAGDNRPAVLSRLRRMSANVVSFMIGCGLAALAWTKVGNACFLLPPAVAFLLLLLLPIEKPKPA